MSARTPPRFVPTLTTVLEEQAGAAPAAEPPKAAAPAPARTSEPAAAPAAEPAKAVVPDPQPPLSEADAFRLEEQLLHRVLQRVDLSLEERLSETVSAAVQRQLDSMIPRLRDEIEAALRALVSEALAQELSDNTGSTPPLGR